MPGDHDNDFTNDPEGGAAFQDLARKLKLEHARKLQKLFQAQLDTEPTLPLASEGSVPPECPGGDNAADGKAKDAPQEGGGNGSDIVNDAKRRRLEKMKIEFPQFPADAEVQLGSSSFPAEIVVNGAIYFDAKHSVEWAEAGEKDYARFFDRINKRKKDTVFVIREDSDKELRDKIATLLDKKDLGKSYVYWARKDAGVLTPGKQARKNAAEDLEEKSSSPSKPAKTNWEPEVPTLELGEGETVSLLAEADAKAAGFGSSTTIRIGEENKKLYFLLSDTVEHGQQSDCQQRKARRWANKLNQKATAQCGCSTTPDGEQVLAKMVYRSCSGISEKASLQNKSQKQGGPGRNSNAFAFWVCAETWQKTDGLLTPIQQKSDELSAKTNAPEETATDTKNDPDTNGKDVE